MNRKLILALVSYRIVNGSFVKSLQLNLKESFKADGIKNISERARECFVLSKINESDSNVLNFQTEM